ncbi:hypothetical protein ACFP2T_19420 [Plantactinospora solaniradicis]|uniref:Uncharacterized protein n=1 Tax=Plantactinospora solaniradicis TaxID=1723736 RepID=A0ABW1KBM3_9ACTN
MSHADAALTPRARLRLARGRRAVANVHGFVANTANYSVLREEYFRADDVVNGQPVRLSRWVDGNPFVDEVPYAKHMRELLAWRAFPGRPWR